MLEKRSNVLIWYVDPATGGLVAGSLWGILLAVFTIVSAVIVKYIFRPIQKLFQLIKTNKKQVSIILIVLLLIGGGLSMLADKSTDTEKKVLLIGIDAFDPWVAEKLMNQGKLPHFAQLRDQKGYAHLQTTFPPESPVAWSAAATGSNPGRFGIFDFVHRDPHTYLPTLSLAQETMGFRGTAYISGLQGTPFWRITSKNNIPTTVIRWPVTFPPETITGNMLSGLGTVDVKGFSNSYSFYTQNDVNSNPGDVGKVIRVTPKNNTIETTLFGPLRKNGDSVEESTIPLHITIENSSITLDIDGEQHIIPEKEWSNWISIRFRPAFLTTVDVIFTVYVLSTDPFEMYLSSLQIDPTKQVVPITSPPEYGEELAQDIGLFATLGIPEETKALTENRITKDIFLEQIKKIESERTRMFWYEFDRFDKGVLAFAFDAGDRLQHIFWNSSEIPREIEEYYTEKDKLLGEILHKIDNATTLIVFSDHGFSSFERAVSVNTWLVENGYMTLKNDIPQNESGGLFASVDWTKTRAYSLGFASVYINEKNREAQGIVAAQEKNQLLLEIQEQLRNLTDPVTGTKVFSNISQGKELYSGPFVDQGPDLVLGFQKGYRMSWQNAIGGFNPQVISDNTLPWKGDHLIDPRHVPGAVFSNLPLEHASPSLIDIAPTVLSELGLAIPKDMEGKSLVSL